MKKWSLILYSLADAKSAPSYSSDLHLSVFQNRPNSSKICSKKFLNKKKDQNGICLIKKVDKDAICPINHLCSELRNSFCWTKRSSLSTHNSCQLQIIILCCISNLCQILRWTKYKSLIFNIAAYSISLLRLVKIFGILCNLLTFMLKTGKDTFTTHY